MPVNRKMMANMIKEYGSKGKDIYYATENKMKNKGKKKKGNLTKALKG